MRYKFFQNGNKVICVSSYAGKRVRGVAICSDKDDFDFETGKRLAQLRCDKKIAEKRFARANQKLSEAEDMVVDITEYYNRMLDYYDDAYNDLSDINLALDELTENL